MSNREIILKQALKLFAERGYDAVGVQEIAEAAAIKKPTLYHYFGSKRGLLQTLLKEHMEPFLEEFQRAAQYQGDVTLALRSSTGCIFEFVRREPIFYRFFLTQTLAPAGSEAFQEAASYSLRQHGLLVNLFSAAAMDHGNMKGRQEMYAASFLGLLNTYITYSLNGLNVMDERLLNSVIHQFMHGIFS